MDDDRIFGVRGISLQAEEDTGPTIAPKGPNNLWEESQHWVRGTWPVNFSASDPSGVCSIQTVVNGQIVAGPDRLNPDTSNWQQCPSQELDHQLDTSAYPDGPLQLTLDAQNAAGVWSSPTQTVPIDNQPVGLKLSGPTDVPVEAGTQYLTATASAGPSGVGSISCTVDGQQEVFPASSARIPVSGLGTHSLTCVAHNNAIDSSGTVASSAPTGWTLMIREPAVSAVSFARLADTLRCGKERERVRVPAHWIIEHVHHHKVRVHVPAQTRSIMVVRCHPKVVEKRVRVGGHWVIKHVVLLPRKVRRSTKRVRFGKTAVVSGWLGTEDGRALGGQVVNVMTAADNGRNRYHTATQATTGRDGTWTARLPAGPSRLVRAVYRGSATVRPAASEEAHLIVPANVALAVSPRSTHWGGRIEIRGRLRGSYVPRAGELVVLWIGWPGGSTEIGHIYARHGGRFATPYTFLRGSGTQTYRLWAVTAREGNYPYAPNRSRRISVTVGP